MSAGVMLTTSAGHQVPAAEVADWVGMHYRVNFETSGSRRQEWIDRFAASQGDRYPTFLVAENWGHIFVGRTESTTRWVYRLGGEHEGIVAGQVLSCNRWVDLKRISLEDLAESINDNDIPDTYREAWSTEVSATTELPDWANRREASADLPGGDSTPGTAPPSKGAGEAPGHFERPGA